jgi:DNA-binding response OmpR family regulator
MNDGAGHTILLVDDDAAQAALVVRTLTTAGYRVDYQRDGLDGLVALEDERQDLVVLDWYLPHLTGAIFLSAVFAGLDDPPPVVVLAAEIDHDIALDAGASACLPAPPDATAIVRVVRDLLGGAKAARRPRTDLRHARRGIGG